MCNGRILVEVMGKGSSGMEDTLCFDAVAECICDCTCIFLNTSDPAWIFHIDLPDPKCPLFLYMV